MKRFLSRGIYLLATFAILLIVFSLGIKNIIMFFSLLILFLLSGGLFIYDLNTQKISGFIARHKKLALFTLTAALVIGIALACHFIHPISTFFEFSVPNVLSGADLFSYYTAQLSVTFISISVLSVLSDKSVKIYWANISEDRLIKPTFSCFAAYTYYSIGATLGSGIAVIQKNGLMFAAFFALNILVMITLTLSMIDVYYGRDTKIKKLRKEFQTDYILCRNVEENNSTHKYHIAGQERYAEKILGLREHCYNAFANNDLTELKEIYSLYAECSECFNLEAGKSAVSTIVGTVEEKTLSLFLVHLLDGHLNNLKALDKKQIADYLDGEKYYRNYFCFSDESLWTAINESSFLGGWLKGEYKIAGNTTEKLLISMKQRMALIYNYLVLDRAENDADFSPTDYLVKINQFGEITKYSSADTIEPEKLGEIFGIYQAELFEDSLLVSVIIKITLSIFHCDFRDYEPEEALSDFPYLDCFKAEEG